MYTPRENISFRSTTEIISTLCGKVSIHIAYIIGKNPTWTKNDIHFVLQKHFDHFFQ